MQSNLREHLIDETEHSQIGGMEIDASEVGSDEMDRDTAEQKSNYAATICFDIVNSVLTTGICLGFGMAGIDNPSIAIPLAAVIGFISQSCAGCEPNSGRHCTSINIPGVGASVLGGALTCLMAPYNKILRLPVDAAIGLASYGLFRSIAHFVVKEDPAATISNDIENNRSEVVGI